MNANSHSKKQFAYPLKWRLFDAIEAIFETVALPKMRAATPYIWLAPALALIGLLGVGMFLMLDASFRELDRSTFTLSSTYSLVNYARLADYSVFKAVLVRSVLASLVVTVTTVALALPYAYTMVRTEGARTRKLLLFCLFVPFFIGAVVRGYSWVIVLGREGLVNDFFGLFGFEPFRILFTPLAVVIGMVQYMLPFAVLMIAPAITSIPKEVELAAEGLGANWRRTIWEVVLPLAKPGIVSATIVVFTLSITDYAMPYMMGGGMYDFVSNLVVDIFLGISDRGLGAALVVVLVALGSLIVTAIFLAFDYRTILRKKTFINKQLP
ncbi:MAG: ABC transporter permease [Hyphomicrobiales bacterium]|nr:ABC transporter permease [Hyphomicrobiales bacterium]